MAGEIGISLGLRQLDEAAGGSYHADAVHFGDGTALTKDFPITEAPVSKFLVSVWLANTALAPGQPRVDHFIAASFENGGLLFGSYQINNTPLYFQVRQDPSHVYQRGTTENFYLVGATWKHAVFSVDTSDANPANWRGQIYVDGSDKSGPETKESGPVEFPSNGGDPGETALFIGDSGNGQYTLFDMADLQIWFGVAPDLSVASNLKKFIKNGRPVDPTIAAAAFGQQSILLSGDAASFGTNQGSVGAFTLIGGPLTNASTSPSD